MTDHDQNLAEAIRLLNRADELADAAHQLLDGIIQPLMDSGDVPAMQRLISVLPSGFHKSELRVFISTK